MTTTTRNEAAERLRHDFRKFEGFETDFDDALAAERRATVERIRLGLSKVDAFEPYNASLVRFANAVYVLLDEEAAR